MTWRPFSTTWCPFSRRSDGRDSRKPRSSGGRTRSRPSGIVRQADLLRIHARWHSTLGNYEALLAERGDVVVPAADFIGEWVKVLRRIVTDIEAERVEFEDVDLFLRTTALLAA